MVRIHRNRNAKNLNKMSYYMVLLRLIGIMQYKTIFFYYLNSLCTCVETKLKCYHFINLKSIWIKYKNGIQNSKKE